MKEAPSFSSIILLLLGALMLSPFIVGILISFMPANELMARDVSFWPTRPGNYLRLVQDLPFARYLLNSVLVTGAITLGSLLTGILAAYVFARATFRGRDLLFALVILTLMIPSHVTLIPNYLTLAGAGLIDTYWALILPFVASGFVTFFLRQQFKGIPRELDDAALIDGATRWQILWKIIVPMSRPAIATMALFQFLTEWNAYLWPLIATTSDEMRTLQIGLSKAYSTDLQDGVVDWPKIMAGAVLVALPTVVLYLLTERDLTKGIAMTVSK
ncbi:MAG: carbohydrate ABC transporter permease [Geminicoccaceae bacterium]